MNCDCNKLREDFLNLSKDILVKGDGKPQREEFEQFFAKYKINDTQQSFPYENRFCSQKVFSSFTSKLNKILLDTTLSTLLFDLLTVLYFKKCAGTPVRRLWSIYISSSDRETLRVIGALRGWVSCSDYIKLLLNFGFLSSLPIKSDILMEELEHEFATFILKVDGGISKPLSYSVRRKAMELLLKCNFNHISDRECYKRMFLVVKALRGVQMSLEIKDNPLSEQFFCCLRMYFSAIRDALISVFEVRSILYASFLVINKLHLCEMYFQEFHKLMPECPAKIEPRKLTHLVRCQIRQNLKASHIPLPVAVDKLPLPEILKKFVLGEILDISRNKGDVSSQKLVTLSELEIMMSEHNLSYSEFHKSVSDF